MKTLFLIFIFSMFIVIGGDAQNDNIIILHANIITAAHKGERKQAVVIRDRKFIYVGTSKQARTFKNKNAVIIDARGKTIIPGFNDAHIHPSPQMPFEHVEHVLRLDTVTSVSSLINIISKKAAITPDGMLIRGRGYNESKLGTEPLAKIIDKATTKHPVILVHASGHKSAINSYLLSINQITKNTTDPAGGKFDRDVLGNPNGICKESAAQNLTKNQAIKPYPSVSFDEEVKNYENYFRDLLSYGITSIGDAGADTNRLKVYQALAQQNFPMRFNVIILDKLLPDVEGGDGTHEADAWKVLAWYGENKIKQVQNDFLRVKSIKVFHGNSLSGKTCWLYQPYNMVNPTSGKMDYYGIPYKRSQSELDSLFLAIHRKGLQICVHSNGDREIDMVLNAFEKVHADGNPLQLHHRIEHCSVVNDSIIKRIKRLGVIPVLHCYINELGDLLEPYGNDRLNNMFATKSFLNASVLPALHSDAPVSDYNTLERWESAVERIAPSGKVLGVKQCIDAEDALMMYTKGSAAATNELAVKGTIEIGKFADFILLDKDPTIISPKQIHALQIINTWVGGKLVYEASKK